MLQFSTVGRLSSALVSRLWVLLTAQYEIIHFGSREGFLELPVLISFCLKLSAGQEGNTLSQSEYLKT